MNLADGIPVGHYAMTVNTKQVVRILGPAQYNLLMHRPTGRHSCKVYSQLVELIPPFTKETKEHIKKYPYDGVAAAPLSAMRYLGLKDPRDGG